MRTDRTDPPMPTDRGPDLVRTSPALKTAWLAVGSLAAVFGLLMGTVQTVGLIAHEEHTERATIDDPAIAVLDVASDGGRIEVIGADVDDVRITAHISDGIAATRYTHDVVGDRLQVRVRCTFLMGNHWCRAALRIVVPRDMEVKLQNSQDGISIRGVRGRVDAESSDGSVEAEALSGPVRLHSDNGSVRGSRLRTESIEADSNNGSVHLEFDDPPLSAIADSDNGSVEIAVPRDGTGYDVQLSSDLGSTDNAVHTDSTSDRRIVATSNNGSVTVRYLD